MTLWTFHLIAVSLLAGTYVGLTVARKIRERRDEALTEASGGRWRFRAQIPFPAPDPYMRFDILANIIGPAMIFDTMEGTDEGFKVAYFDAYIDDRVHEHCAIVDLPVEGPTLDPSTPADERRDAGPMTSDVLASIGDGMEVHSAPFTILVHSTQPAAAVRKAAIRLAHAIVTDAKIPRAAE